MHPHLTRLCTSLALMMITASALTSASTAARTMAYVSNADSRDIYVMELNQADGSAAMIEKVATGGSVMPLAISPDRRFLYASLRSAPYAVSSFAIDQHSGKLNLLSTVPLPDNMANLATDKTGRFLLAASYTGNKISINPIAAKGDVETVPVAVIPTREKAHAIATDPSNTHLFASNLGGDIILQYRFDAASGQVTPNQPPYVETKPGAGPRHFVFDRRARFVYGTNELDGSLSTYRYDAGSGAMTLQASISLRPKDFQGAPLAPADLHLTPNGRFLYASERTSSTLAGFAVDPDSGALTLIGNFPTETQPRGFNIDPSGHFLLAVGQKSNRMSSYAIDQTTGALRLLHQYEMGKNPNWVEIIDLP
jgi:6-phosphogluconolactonase